MTRPCPNRITCPPDQPGTNFSSEGVDLLDYPSVFYIENPPPLGKDWTSNGCIGICTSTVSQEDADLCALQQAVNCTHDRTNTETFTNGPQECASLCPDGSIFTFVVPAGRFSGASQAEADAAAFAYACTQANLQRLCLGNLSPCLCNGVKFSAKLTVEGPFRPLAFTIATGALPDGLTIDGNVRLDMQTVIQGTPKTAGTYSFTVHATDANGSYASKIFTLHVIEISDTTLPDFEVGVPYSHQLTAAGGSGNYAFKVASGSFPPGLGMSVGGLITGTPTGGSSGTLTFEVVDTDCEETDKTFFPPRIAMTTRSTTRILTILGYPEFPGFISTPPKKYKKLTWEGRSYQWGVSLKTGQNAGWAEYLMSGTGEISGNGSQVTNYDKSLLVSCAKTQQWPLYSANANEQIFSSSIPGVMKGYCWTPDPNSCSSCPTPPALASDASINSTTDWSNFLGGNIASDCNSTHFESHHVGPQPTQQWRGEWSTGTRYVLNDRVGRLHFYWQCITANGPSQPDQFPQNWAQVPDQPADNFRGTWASPNQYETGDGVEWNGVFYVALAHSGPSKPEENFDKWLLLPGFSLQGILLGPVNFPQDIFNNISGSWIWLRGAHWYDGTLEDEYTDLEASANAKVITGNGNTTESKTRTIGFVSKYTSVSYQLLMTNLLSGQSYKASVRFYNTTTGASTLRTYTFLASGDSHSISDVMPSAPEGQPIQVKNPTVAFS